VYEPRCLLSTSAESASAPAQGICRGSFHGFQVLPRKRIGITGATPVRSLGRIDAAL